MGNIKNIVLAVSTASLIGMFTGIAEARCKVSMPSKNWSKSRSKGSVQFICKNQSCGGKQYLLRFGDRRVIGRGLNKIPIGNPGRTPLRYDGLSGRRISDSHGKITHINETYFGKKRMVGFYSEGRSKGQVAKNFRLLKASANCR